MRWLPSLCRIIALGSLILPAPAAVVGSQDLAPESLRCPGHLPPGAPAVSGWEVLPTYRFPEPLPGSAGPVAVALDRACNLYVADSLHRQVVKLAPDGTILGQWPMPP